MSVKFTFTLSVAVFEIFLKGPSNNKMFCKTFEKEC